MNRTALSSSLAEKGLKVTPQRIAILDSIIKLKSHPTAENIIEFIRKHNPHIATATVYKVLDTLTEKGLIKRVKTEKGIMRYDSVLENHHHLYCKETERIEDYYDEELSQMIDDYFRNKEIADFRIEEIKLQIIGKFSDKNL